MASGSVSFVHRYAFIHDRFLQSPQMSKPVLTSRHLSVNLFMYILDYFNFLFYHYYCWSSADLKKRGLICLLPHAAALQYVYAYFEAFNFRWQF